MTEDEKSILEQLKKDKDYEQIFRQFGQKEFLRNVDRKYKKQDIKKLQKEGKFEDIYVKYGKRTYNKDLRRFKQKEIEDVYGKRSIQAIIGRIKLAGAAFLTALGIGSPIGIASSGITTTLNAANHTIQNAEDFREESEENYKEEIQEYEEAIQEYAENINKLNLTDLETIMKVQEDMWATIKGYDNPEIDIAGCQGLDIWIGKKGVCRNMADDVARKLNAINPEYNARICSVKSEENNLQFADINRIAFDLDETRKEGGYIGLEVYLPNYMNHEDKLEAINSNHEIVLVDIPEDNLTLVIDPTNAVLGTFQNGKIHILNISTEQKEDKTKRKIWCDLMRREDISAWDIPKEYAKSFLPTKLSKEEIEEKYGVEAQNAALDSANKKEQEYIYQTSKKEQSFKSSLQVNSKEDIYSSEELKDSYETWMAMLDENITNEEFSNILRDAGKWYDSIQYYNDKKEELLGTEILNPSMLIQAELDIDVQYFVNKLNVKKLAIGYTYENEHETNNIMATQDRTKREIQEDLGEEL